MGTYTTAELEEEYEGMTGQVLVEAKLTSDLVGGLPADTEGIRAFCKHHLHLDGDDLEGAVRRITRVELGDREVTPELGEVIEREAYSVNVLRRTEDGYAYLGDWMIKACAKCAASKLGLFRSKLGTKGDVAEMGSVRAWGNSTRGYRNQICFYDDEGKPFSDRIWQRLPGHVTTPRGGKSILQDVEVVPMGYRFAFEMRIPMGKGAEKKVTEKDIVRIVAAMGVVGVGSARSLERGKFTVLSLEVTDNR